MIPAKRMFLVLVILGLVVSVGCGSSSTHTAYVSLPTSNAVAAFRIDNHSAKLTSIVGSPYPAGNSPSSVVAHPAGKFVYVANQSDDTIELFSIDATIGSLLEVPPRIKTGLAPTAMVMDSAGSLLFAINELSSNISAYSATSGTGVLKAVAGSPFTTFNNPVALALAPSAKFLYVVNANLSAVIAYSNTSGVLAQVAVPVPVGAGPSGIAVDPSEKFVYVANSGSNTVSVLAINPASGALTLVGSYATGTQPFSVAVLGGFLYVGNLTSTNISAFAVDSTTGVLTQTKNSPFTTGGPPLFEVIDPNGKFLYAGSQSSSLISVLTINSSTGDLAVTAQSASTATAPSSMSISK